MRAVLLAAGVGSRLAPLTDDRPKCLLEVGGQTLLARHLAAFAELGLRDVSVVVGHLRDRVEDALTAAPAILRVRTVHNARYREGSVLSLAAGLRGLDEDAIVMDADVVYDPRVLARLVGGRGSRALVDPRSEERGEEMMIGVRGERCAAIGRRIAHRGPFDLAGESVGFFRIAREHLPALRGALAALPPRAEHEAALDRLFATVEVGWARVDDLAWTEIDFPEDLAFARERVVGPADAP